MQHFDTSRPNVSAGKQLVKFVCWMLFPFAKLHFVFFYFTVTRHHSFDPCIFLLTPISLSSFLRLSVSVCDLPSSEEWARCRLSSAHSSAWVKAESNRLDERWCCSCFCSAGSPTLLLCCVFGVFLQPVRLRVWVLIAERLLSEGCSPWMREWAGSQCQAVQVSINWSGCREIGGGGRKQEMKKGCEAWPASSDRGLK